MQEPRRIAACLLTLKEGGGFPSYAGAQTIYSMLGTSEEWGGRPLMQEPRRIATCLLILREGGGRPSHAGAQTLSCGMHSEILAKCVATWCYQQLAS